MQDNKLLGENPKATVNANTDMSQEYQLSEGFGQRFADYKAKQAPAKDYDVTLGDGVKAVASGALGIVSGLGEFSNQVTGYGAGLRDFAQSGSDALVNSMTDDGKAALSAELVHEDKSGKLSVGSGADDIGVWAMKFAQGIGSLVGVMGTGGVAGGVTKMVTASMLKRGASKFVAESVAARTAALLGETSATTAIFGSSHGSAMADGRQQVLDMDAGWLAQNSEHFQDSLRRIASDPNYEGLSSSEKVDMAKEETANFVSKTIGLDPTTIAASVAGAFGDKLLFGAVAGHGAKGIVKGAGKGALTEASTEAIENAGQTYGQNVSINEVAGTKRNAFEGVAKNAIEGAAIGGLTGGVVGGFGGVRGKRTGEEYESTQTTNINQDPEHNPAQDPVVGQDETQVPPASQPFRDAQRDGQPNLDIPAYERQALDATENNAQTMQGALNQAIDDRNSTSMDVPSYVRAGKKVETKLPVRTRRDDVKQLTTDTRKALKDKGVLADPLPSKDIIDLAREYDPDRAAQIEKELSDPTIDESPEYADSLEQEYQTLADQARQLDVDPLSASINRRVESNKKELAQREKTLIPQDEQVIQSDQIEPNQLGDALDVSKNEPDQQTNSLLANENESNLREEEYNKIREKVKASLLPEDQGKDELVDRLTKIEFDHKFNDAPVEKRDWNKAEPYQDKGKPFSRERAQGEINDRAIQAQDAVLQREAEQERASRQDQPEANPNWIIDDNGSPVTRMFMRDKANQQLQSERDNISRQEEAQSKTNSIKQSIRDRLGNNTDGRFQQFNNDANRVEQGLPTQSRIDTLKSEAKQRELERTFGNKSIKNGMSKRLRRKIQRSKGFNADAVLAEFQNHEKRLQAYQEEARRQAEREANDPDNIKRRKNAQALFEEKIASPEAKQFSENLITESIKRVHQAIDQSAGTVLEMDGQQTTLPKIKAQMAHSVRNLANKFVGKTAALNDSLRARRAANDEQQSNSNQGTAKQVVGSDITNAIDDAAIETNTNPTDAQKEAGNYKKGTVNIHGMAIAIENPAGSERSGSDKNGKPWSVKMKNHYGYVKGTNGADGDQVDVFIGPDPDNERVFVIDQVDPDTGAFDEHKVMIGFDDAYQASRAYNSNYAKGWGGFGHVTDMTMPEFKEWLNSGNTDKPLNKSVPAQKESPATDTATPAKQDVEAKPAIPQSVKEKQTTQQPYDELPEILRKPKSQQIKKMAKDRKLKESSPGYAQAMKDLESNYEDDYDRALAKLPFEQYQELNLDTSESINRQAHQQLRDEFGLDNLDVKQSKDTSKPKENPVTDTALSAKSDVEVKPIVHEDDNQSEDNGLVFFSRAARSTADAGEVKVVNPIDVSLTSSWVRDIVSRFDIVKNHASIIQIIPTESDLPNHIKSYADQKKPGEKTYGVYDNRTQKIYIVADEHNDLPSLEKTIFHELFGHYGLRKLFSKENGRDIEVELENIRNEMGGTKGILELAKKFEVDLSKYKETFNVYEKQGMITNEQADHLLIDELIAHVVEEPRVAPLVDKLVSKTRTALKSMGFSRLPKYGKTDLLKLISNIKTNLKENPLDNLKYSHESITNDKPTKGMTLKLAQLAADQWLKDYNGGAGVKIHVVKTQAEAEKIVGMNFEGSIVHALYSDAAGEVVVVADNIADPAMLRKKLRHEVIVHHGLKAVVGDSEYQTILERVYRGKNSPYLKDIWSKVEHSYKQFSAVDQVEEVLAHASESERSTVQQWLDGIIEMIAHALRKVGLMKPSDITKAELNNIVKTIADRTKRVNHWASNKPKASNQTTVKFSQNQNEVDDYLSRLNKATGSLRSRVEPVKVMDTPDVLKHVGMPDLPIYITRDIVRKATNGAKDEDHELDLSVIHNLPNLLSDPVAVFKPKNSNIAKNGSKNILVEATTQSGKNVIVAVHANASEYRMVVNRIASAYGKNQQSYNSWIKDGLLEYVKSKNPEWLRWQGLQLPKERGFHQGSTGSLLTKEDIVKGPDSMPDLSFKGDVKFSREAAIENNSFGVPTDTLLDVALVKFSDKFKPIKDLQASIKEAGGKVTEDNDVYLAEELFHGKAENDLRLMKENFVQPLVKKMSDYGITQDALDNYLIAKHAKERNQHIASINSKMPDGGSGMKTADAESELNKIKSRGEIKKYEDVASIVYAMNQKQRDLLVESGLEDDGLVSAWEDKYQYYVPLKGVASDQKSMPRTGKGFAIGGKESKRAMGRNSLAKSPSSQAIVDLSEKLIRAQKNEVANTLLKLAQDNPNPDIWNVFTLGNPDTHRQITTENGKEVIKDMPVPMALMGDKYLPAKKDGKIYYIKLEDERLMKAMKNITPDASNFLINAMSKVNRYLAAINTSFNPEFVIGNFSRDIQTALLNLKAEESRDDGRIKGENIAKKTIKDIGKAGKVIFASVRGKTLDGEDGKWQNYYDEFLADGGKTGFLDMKDVDSQRAELNAMLERESGSLKGKSLKALDKIVNAVETTNYVVENSARLSAYINAREVGISRKKAASLAKNMTVNFNRKGTHGQYLSAMYLFANASIQGTANFARTMYGLNGDKSLKWKNLNTAQKIAIGVIASSALLAAANRAGAGDDDDGENWYGKVPDYEKERNIIIMKSLLGGEQDGSYWKIPLPYGYNIFSVLGSSIEAVGSGGQSTLKAAGNLATAMASSFSPIGFSESATGYGFILKNALPTITNPLVELALNENFMGKTIYTENSPFGTPKPDSSLGRRYTPQAYKDFAEFVNDTTGGSKFREGLIDVNPDSLKYLMNYITGGAGRFISDKMIATPLDALQGSDDIEDRNIMFLSRVSGRVMPYEDQSLYYQRRDELSQLHDEYKFASSDERASLMEEYRGQLSLYSQLKSVDKQLTALRKRRDAVYGSDSPKAERDIKLKAIEKQMKAVIDGFNYRYKTVTE
jgi:hypothetical protein